MIFTIHTIGGVEFLQSFFNAIAIMMSSKQYESMLHLVVVCGLLFHIFKTATTGAYTEMMKWGALCYLAFALMVIPKVTIVIEDSTNPSQNRRVDNIPIGLALPASIISNIDKGLASMFDMSTSIPGDISYTKSGMLFGSGLLDTITKIKIPSVIEQNINEFIRQCVFDQIVLGNIKPEEIKNSTNVKSILLNKERHSNILHVRYIDAGNSYNRLNISCKEASIKLKDDLGKQSNNIILKITSLLNPLIKDKDGNKIPPNTGKMMQQITDMSGYLLKSSQKAEDILEQGVMLQAFLNGMDKRKSLSKTDNPYAQYKARLHSRESWKVMGANAPTYVIILKLFIQSLLYSLFPIIIVMILSGIFGMNILLEYFKALFALVLISPILAILNRISYGVSSFRFNGVLDGADSITLANIASLQELNSDIMAFTGYLSIASIPLAFTLIQRGITAIGTSIASSLQSSINMNTSQVAGEMVSGNYSLGNTSIGNNSLYNDSMYNSSKHNINDYNKSVGNESMDNITRGNESLNNQSANNITRGNESYDNITANNQSFNNKSSNTLAENTIAKNTSSVDVHSRNMTTANKHDTAKLKREGFTEIEDSKGKITIDNATNKETQVLYKPSDVGTKITNTETDTNEKNIAQKITMGLSGGLKAIGSFFGFSEDRSHSSTHASSQSIQDDIQTQKVILNSLNEGDKNRPIEEKIEDAQNAINDHRKPPVEKVEGVAKSAAKGFMDFAKAYQEGQENMYSHEAKSDYIKNITQRSEGFNSKEEGENAMKNTLVKTKKEEDK